MDDLTIEKYKILPYINEEVLKNYDGRQILFCPFYNENMWKLPLWIQDKILLSPGAFPASSLYIAKEIIDKKQDIYISILDFAYKHISYPTITYHITGLINNFEALFTIVSKIDNYIFNNYRNIVISDFVKTDMEYLFIVCKRTYDVLQQIINIIWKNVNLLNGIEKKNLPDKFRNIVIKDKKKCSIDEIISNYNLPETLAKFYVEQIDFYEKIKNIRDDIIHREKTFDIFYIIENGIGIKNSDKLFKTFNNLNKENQNINNIYSIRPLLNYLITNTIMSCCEFCECITENIEMPDPMIINNFNIYLRSPSVESFIKMNNELKETSWWKK